MLPFSFSRVSLRLYQVIIPQNDNEGKSYAPRHLKFCERLLAEFGGFTSFEAFGGWSHNGIMQREAVEVYQVAIKSPPDFYPNDVNIDALTAMAHKYFPDQTAFMVSEIGVTMITYPKKEVEHA